jgi:hypothetical protein
MDQNFFIRKAQALLRLADATDDPTIADRLRDMAAHCYSHAEFLSEEEPADVFVPPVKRATND